MGSKGGGQAATINSMNATSQNTSGSSSGVTSQTPDPLAGLAYQQVLRNASQIANTPYQPYQGQQVAGFTPDTQAGFQGVRNMQGIQNPYISQSGNLYEQSTNTWQNPYLPKAEGYFGQSFGAANNPYLPKAEGYYGQTFGFADPNRFTQENLQRYMNPYQSQVIDATLAQMKQNQDVLQNQNTANAIRQGAYGGSGQFMGQAELGRQQALSNAQTLAGLNAQNYQQAMGQYNQQQQQAIQAYQDAAKTLGQLGGQQASLLTNAYQNAAQTMGQLGQSQQQLGVNALQGAAAGVSGLGKQAQQAALADAQALMQTGEVQRQLQQEQLNKAYEQWQQAKAYPYQQTSYFANLAQGVGPLMGQYGTTAANQQGTMSGFESGNKQTMTSGGGGGVLGAITSGLGILSALKDGGVVSDRKRRATGGYMEDVGKLPYGEGPIDLKAGFGSLMQKTPFSDAPGNYIGEAEKTSKVMRSAKELGAEKLQSEINKALGLIPKEKKMGSLDMGDDSSGEESKSSDYGKKAAGYIGDIDKKFNLGLGDSASSIFGSSGTEGAGSGGFDFGGIGDAISGLFKDGGRVGRADGGSFAEQALRAKQEQKQAQDVLANYRDLLGRNAEQGGFDYWTARAREGQTPEQRAKLFSNSPERERQVRTAYVDILGRPAEPGGYNYWLNRAKQGMSFGDLQGDIKNSVESLYHNILGREGEQAGADFWNKQIQSGMRPTDVMLSFQSSPEARANAVAAANAPIESKVKSGWAALDPSAGLNKAIAREKMIDPLDKPKSNYEMLLMQARGMHPGPQLTPEQQGMPSMPGQRYYTGEESYGQLGAPTSTVSKDDAGSAAQIENLYHALLGRNSDQGGMDYWLGQLKGGASLGDIANQFKHAQEYTSTPDIFRSNAPVQGYFTSIANTQFNPDTGLFNLQYNAPYRGSTPPYDLSSGIAASDKLRGVVTDKLTSQLPKTSASGGRIGKAAGGSLSGKSLYDYFINLGANPKEATMLTGMAKAESNFNPSVMHDNNTGYGLWGHGKDRWADMQKYTGQRKPGWEDQAKFALWELRNSPKTAMARQTLARADDPREITIAGMHFERPRGYKANAPWLGDNWQGRLSNVTNLALGRDLGKGPSLELAGGQPNRDSMMFKNVATPASSAPRRNLLSRLIHELAPVGTAQAAETQSAEPKKSLLEWPKLRNFKTNDLPTALGMNQPELPAWKKEVQTGFGTLGEDRPADQAQLLAEPTKHAAMGPEMEVPTPPKRSDAFPVVAEDREQGKKYYGDWRDAEPFASDPIGGFFDALSGEEKKKDKPGTWSVGEPIDFGGLFGFAKGGVVRRHYALGGGEEDLGNPLEELGSMIEQGFGGLFGGGDEAPTREAPEAGGGLGDLLGGGEEATPKGVVAQDRPTPSAEPSMPQRGFLPPAVSQALIAAGMGMMASPRSNPFEAFGEGGLKGFQVYQTARAQEDKEAKEAAQQRAAAEYDQRLSGVPVAGDREETEATPTGRGAVSSGSNVDVLMSEMERLSSIPAVTPQQIQQKNAKLRELQTRITIAEKIDEHRSGKTGTIGRDEFGNPIMGYTSGPNAGKSLAEVRREQGQPSGAQEPGAVDWSKTGEEFLSTLPVEDQNEVKGIAEGRLDLPKGPRAQGLWKAVTRYSPGFDTTVYGARKKMRDSYADQSGTKPGAQITAGNTAIGHAGELSDLILKLNNYDIDIFNKPLNWVAERYGGEAAQNLNKYRSLVDKYVDEQTSFYKGRGGGGIEERREARERLDPSKGTKVLLDTLRGDQEAMGSKVSELEEAWNRTMGKGQSVPVENYDVISKHGKEGKALLEHNFKVASGEAKPVRTGRTKDGRKVTQYSDGYIKYGE